MLSLFWECRVGTYIGSRRKSAFGVRDPWWNNADLILPEWTSPKRVYFASFKNLALNFAVKRATVLLGPRRVGKTYMVKQLIQAALNAGIAGKDILYVSIDAPIYLGMTLEQFLKCMPSSEFVTEAHYFR